MHYSEKTGLSSLFITLMFFAASIAAQTPQIVTTLPSTNALNVPPSASISVTFDIDMDAITFNSGTIIVSGNITGPHAGVISYDIPSKTVSYNPDIDFDIGEIVTVTITTGISSQTGTFLAAPHIFTFTTAVTNTPTGTMVYSHSQSLGLKAYNPIVVDIDGDTDPDILGLDTDGDVIQINNNNGDGSFIFGGAFPCGGNPTDMEAGDFDRDGDFDLAIGRNTSPFGISVIFNAGGGTFGAPVKYSTPSAPIVLKAADVNGDGYTDLAILMESIYSIYIFMNNQDGTFGLPQMYECDISPKDLQIADLDNDGDLDFVIVHRRNTCHLSIFLNDGAGLLGPPTTYPVYGGALGVFAADIDGDGDNDLVTRHGWYGLVGVLYNNGDGIFMDGGLFITGESTKMSLPGDFDGDGDIDIISVNSYLADITLLRNNGSGVFMVQRDVYIVDLMYDCLTGDFDRDGDLDLVSMDYSRINLTFFDNGTCIDTDEDGFGDPGHPESLCPEDICPYAYDPYQFDTDGDGIGDACDDCTDGDGDGFGDPGFAANTCPEDNCPSIYNPDQADSDGDGIGDACTIDMATPSGSDVVVDFSPEIRVTFEEVTSSGVTTLWMSTIGPDLAYYQKLPVGGPVYYYFETTAEYEGSVETCFEYNDVGMSDYEENRVRIEQYWGLSWIDWAGITTYIDTSDNVVCGTSRELSTYILAQPQYVCGDANHDGGVNVGDAVLIINYTFKGGDPPIPRQAADSNADNDINIGDAVWDINYCFKGGPPPCCP